MEGVPETHPMNELTNSKFWPRICSLHARHDVRANGFGDVVQCSPYICSRVARLRFVEAGDSVETPADWIVLDLHPKLQSALAWVVEARAVGVPVARKAFTQEARRNAFRRSLVAVYHTCK